MANLNKGEVSFDVNGKKYTMSFSMSATEKLEDMLDMSMAEIGEVMRDPKRFRMKILRSIIVAGLDDYHSGLPEEEIKTITRSMNATTALRLFNEAMSDGAEKNPPEPVPSAAIGAGSSGNGSA